LNQQYATHESPSSPRAGGSRAFFKNLGGILLPFPTPFGPGGDIDEQALNSNIKKWNQTGVIGYVALGSTGERVHLEEHECARVIELARAAVPDNLAFIVGAGQKSTRGTINEVRAAATAGAEAVLVITPHFYRRAITQDALAGHYAAVADTSPVPVILYSVPDLTGIAIAPETVAKLSEHPNIIGIKDSSDDRARLGQTIRLVTDDFAVLTGNGTVLYEALRSGARGAILAVGCVDPRQCIAIFAAVSVRDYERARALQEKLTPLTRAVTTRFGIGGLKAAMDLVGYHGGFVRAPLPAPEEAAREEIAQLLEHAGAERPREIEMRRQARDDERAGDAISFAGGLGQ